MTDKKSYTRREFLNRSAKTAAVMTAASAFTSMTTRPAHARIIGANDRINLAVIGTRSRGRKLTERFLTLPGCRVKTLCDIDENLFAERAKSVNDLQNSEPTYQKDMRRVFEDKDIDAVLIANPNHWHSLSGIWALQADKHVYVEKPCCHNIWEGRQLVKAARKYKKVCQVGFQNRSEPIVQEGIRQLHNGLIGDVYMARVLCFKPRPSIGRCPDGIAPPGKEYDYYVWGKKWPCFDQAYMNKVDYNLWLGPAPVRNFNYNRFHYNWHWHWDYGNGDIGNNAPHDLDIARWGLNKSDLPVKVFSTGGMYVYKDSAQETPNTQVADYEFADGTIMTCEVRGIYTNNEDEVQMGNLFYGSKGWMIINDGQWKSFFGRKNEPGPSSTSAEAKAKSNRLDLTGAGGRPHFANFLKAVRSGNPDDLNCEVEKGYLSCIYTHLANVSYRLKRELHFDGKNERFINDDEANKMLTRDYRAPFVVPKNV